MKNLIIFLVLITATLSAFSQPNQPEYSFTENKGQIRDDKGINHSEILFIGQGLDYSIYLRRNGWSYIIKSYDSLSYQTQRVDIDFENPNAEFRFETINKLPGYDNFPVSNNESINGVCSYSEVVYKEVYSGIDLRFYYDGGNLRYDYIVHTGANPNQISMAIKYSDNPTINQENGINIPTLLGEIRKEKPFAYQFDSTQKVEIPCNYKLSDNKISFNAGNYDISKDLILDPVSLVYGKIRKMKSMFQYSRGTTFDEKKYYSWSLAEKNIKRLKDNSVILLSNTILDNNFIEENYAKVPNIYITSFLPTIISKYDSLCNKEWSVYLYEKHNNVISWDANDSLIVVYAQSYFYIDSTTMEYNKDAVFVSVYDMKGNLLRRFKLTKPEGIIQFIHPQKDDDVYLHREWVWRSSYENTLKIINNQISLIAVGRYPGNNDSTYDCGLFLQTYNIDGYMTFNKKLKQNIFKYRDGKFICESNHFCQGVVGEIHLIRYQNDGSIFMAKEDELFHYDFYDNQGNLEYKLNKDNEILSATFKIDENKNFFSVLHYDSNDPEINKYQNKIRINPYTPNYKKRQPYLVKHDSLGQLLWLTQILSFPENYTIISGPHPLTDSQNTPPLYDGIIGDFEYNFKPRGGIPPPNFRTPMYLGSEIVMAFDSVGNIFIPRIIDSLESKVSSSTRKLVIMKISPDGNLLWQDTSALHFNFDYVSNWDTYSVMRIKNATVIGNSLYLDYFVSNLDGMTPAKDIEKFDLKEIYPKPNLQFLLGDKADEHPIEGSNIVFDLLFLKFNINEKDLVEFTDENIKFDTLCVGQTSTFKFKVTNKWHSKMNFEVPVIEGDGYSITPSGKFSILPNESKEFTVIFSPTEFKTYNAKITFKQNDIANFSSTLNLKGFTKATLLKSDSVWDLGTILLTNTASGVFRIYNNGNVDSWIQGIKDLPNEFKQISPEQTSNYIKGGEYLDYTIEFTPTVAGTFEYKYKIYAGTGCPDTLEVLIKGKGVTESIVIDSDSLDYGELYFCETKTDTITIENVTNLPLTYNSVQITGINADNFTILEKPNDGEILIRGNPAKFVIEFKPLAPYGNKTAILEINTSEKTLKCPIKGEFSDVDISVNDIDMGIRNLNVLYDTVLTIRNNTSDNVTLLSVSPADNRIIINTVLPLEIPSFSSADIDIEINSTIIDVINSKIDFEISANCSTVVKSNVTCKFDSSKAEIKGIDFGKVPYCEERIDSIHIFNTGNSPVQFTEISFIDNDRSFEFVDNLNLPIELLPGQYFAIAVRFLPQGKAKSQNSAKVRTTLMFDGLGKNFDIEIKAERIIPEIEYLTEIDFGRLKPGEIKNLDFEILNRSEEIEISEVKTNLLNFQIKSFSDKIIYNEKGLINLSFSSDIIGEYADEMTVYFSLGDCEDSIKIALKADVSRLMTIWANHHTSEVGIKGYEIPIYADTDIGAQISGKKFKLTLRYLPELYYNVSSLDAQILSKTRDGNYESMVIEDTFPEITSKETVLFHLKGDVLFSPRMTTPIEVEFIESEASLSVTTRDGSLTLDSLCQVPIRGIQQYTPTRMTISPNPTDSELKVSIGSQEQGSFSLVVFDVQGREVYRTEFSKSDKIFEQKDYNINTQNLGNGIYTIHLTAPWTLLREQVVVVR